MMIVATTPKTCVVNEESSFPDEVVVVFVDGEVVDSFLA